MNENKRKKDIDEINIPIRRDQEDRREPIQLHERQSKYKSKEEQKKNKEHGTGTGFSLMNHVQDEEHSKNQLKDDGQRKVSEQIKEKRIREEEDKEYEIPVHINNSSILDNKSDANLWGNRRRNNEMKNNVEPMNLFDIFNINEFPFVSLEKKKKGKKEKEHKIIFEYLDTFNDDFVRKNANREIIFEDIDVCKGVSFLNVKGEDIRKNCVGLKTDALYFYKMIPLNKIYSKQRLKRIFMKKEAQQNESEQSKKSKQRKKADGKFVSTFQWLKKKLPFKEKEKPLFNDLYLSPYEKNMKTSICFGTLIHSKERAVKKCLGLAVEKTNLILDQVQEDTSNLNKNLENLFFDFPFDNEKNVIFKRVAYPFKNKVIVDTSIQTLMKNIPWYKLNHLKEPHFYYDLKNNVSEFTQNMYYTTKNAILHFDSPKDFIVRTSKKVQDINNKMFRICEKSFEIAQGILAKINREPKAS